MGAWIAETPKAVAERCPIVISMLTDPVVIENVLTGSGDMAGSSVLDGVGLGKIVVDYGVIAGLFIHMWRNQ